jgi:bifunctional enzyme CysN/CysC
MFIDVPGHRELLNNMLTGTSYAESALFVIDPCRPVREQAARHMSILKFLGIGRIIPLVNKMDSVEFRRISFEKIRNDLVSFSRELGLCLDRIIPVAAREGDNLAVRSDRMGWYKGPAVLRTLEGRAHKKTDNAFRFVIQDVYQLESERAAVGTIVSGKVKKGARVNLLPSGRKLRIERIRLFEKPVGSAHAPQSAGLTCDTMEGVARGQILCGMKVPEVTRDFSARICCVRECDTRGRFELRIVYQKTSARFVKIGTVRTIEGACAPAGASLKAFDMCGAVIAADDPVVIEGVNELSRFVLKDHAGICAVGICEERVKRKK